MYVNVRRTLVNTDGRRRCARNADVNAHLGFNAGSAQIERAGQPEPEDTKIGKLLLATDRKLTPSGCRFPFVAR